MMNNPKPMHVLHAVPDMNSGGLENYIMNLYRNIDREVIQFDFLLHHSYESFFESEIQELGGRIYKYPVLDTGNIFGYIKYLKGLYTDHPEIRVVHGHMSSLAFLYLNMAKKEKVPLRICHSHSSSTSSNIKGRAKFLLSRFAKKDANMLLACSQVAGKYLFGNAEYEIAYNAIETDKFAFNMNIRGQVRDELNIGDSFTIGHIGRFDVPKNQVFVVDILEELIKLTPAKAVFIGEGKEKEHIRQYVERKGLGEHVIFQEVTSKPYVFYPAFDAFILPSLFEGLPLVGIEAQCSGVPCFFSDAVTKEVDVTDLAHHLALSRGAKDWACCIYRLCGPWADSGDRRRYFQDVSISKYDARLNASSMKDRYLKGIKEAVEVSCFTEKA